MIKIFICNAMVCTRRETKVSLNKTNHSFEYQNFILFYWELLQLWCDKFHCIVSNLWKDEKYSK